MHRFQSMGFPILSPRHMTSPTCDDLGIPHNSEEPPYTLGLLQLSQQDQYKQQQHNNKNNNNHNNNSNIPNDISNSENINSNGGSSSNSDNSNIISNNNSNNNNTNTTTNNNNNNSTNNRNNKNSNGNMLLACHFSSDSSNFGSILQTEEGRGDQRFPMESDPSSMAIPAKKNDPFSPHCLIPLPSHLMDFNGGFEPAFIRKRNERERERVRCVNEGYAQLKKHLPLAQKDKRLSKVETLRTAIHYIRYLEDMLQMSSDTTKGKI